MPLSERALALRDAFAREVLTPHHELAQASRSGRHELRLPRDHDWPRMETFIDPTDRPMTTMQWRVSHHPWVGIPFITAVGVRPSSYQGSEAIEFYVFGTHRVALERIPQTYNGVTVHRRLGGAFYAAASGYGPIRGGVSIGHVTDPRQGGTLGCRVHDTDGRPFILTAGHVLANRGQWAVGDGVLQPARCEGGSPPGNLVATIDRITSLFVDDRVNLVDAARALIVTGRQDDVLTAVEQIGPIGAARHVVEEESSGIWEEVRKRGHSTGLTTGMIEQVHAIVSILEPAGEVARFANQILIASSDGRPFSARGDSGAIVVDVNCNVIGLLHAVDDLGSTTVVTPIRYVLDALDVIV